MLLVKLICISFGRPRASGPHFLIFSRASTLQTGSRSVTTRCSPTRGLCTRSCLAWCSCRGSHTRCTTYGLCRGVEAWVVVREAVAAEQGEVGQAVAGQPAAHRQLCPRSRTMLWKGGLRPMGTRTAQRRWMRLSPTTLWARITLLLAVLLC